MTKAQKAANTAAYMALCAVCVIAALITPAVGAPKKTAQGAQAEEPEPPHISAAMHGSAGWRAQRAEPEAVRTITHEEHMAGIERYEARIDELWLLQEMHGPPLSEAPEDRARPPYEVYKNGRLITAATPELQWMARDIARAHGIPEKFVFGL